MDTNKEVNRRDDDRDRSKRKERSRDKSRERHGDRIREKPRDRSRERHRERSRGRSKDRHRERSRDKDRRSRKDRSRSRSEVREPQRQRKPNRFWDIPPAGFENVSVMEYKAMLASGQVPVPPVSVVGPAVLNTNIPFVGNAVSRQARRLYVGNIPFGIGEEDMKIYFNEQMKVSGLSQLAGDSVIACQINMDKNFAFLEFRSVDECTQAMAFDGLLFNGQSLKIRRPRDYQPLPGTLENPSVTVLGVVSTQVNDSPDKLYVGNLPTVLQEDSVKELLTSFGPLKAFNLVMEVGSALSKGYAFCEYLNPEDTENAVRGLNGLAIGDKNLIVQRASVGKNPLAHGGMLTTMQIPGADIGELKNNINADSCPVLCLSNIVAIEDLENEEDYEDIMEDIREECGKFGTVISLEIPRPIQGVEVRGVGQIFVEFSTSEECKNAEKNLTNRKFNNKRVATKFMDLDTYQRRDF